MVNLDELQRLIDRLQVLSRAVADGRMSEFTMRVPAEPDRDADIVLQRSADALTALRDEVIALRQIATMLDAVVQGAQEEFVRVPYGASHEDVAQINEWHAMAKEARAALSERGEHE